METWMKRVLAFLAVALCLAAPFAQAADEPILKIGGTTYTKWLSGDQKVDGSVYNFTTVPGEGYGDNGQGSEIELLLTARLSKQVQVNSRIHSRFNQNQWTNFGGFGGSPTNPGVGGDRGEFDPRSNQYIKLRGVSVTFTPGYSWINSAVIGANDFGQFDPFVIGKIRYIDRDNGSGLLFQGSTKDRKLSYDVTRISLPRLWAGPNWSTGEYTGADAAYGIQLKMTPSSSVELTALADYVNDTEVNSVDHNLDDGVDVRTRFMNKVFGGKIALHPDPKIDVSALGFSSFANSASDMSGAAGAPGNFGMGGYSSVPAGRLFGQSWRGNLDLNDPFQKGISFQLEGFSISSEYVSMMAARRESDVLLTEGYDGTFAFPGPTNASFGVFGGNPTRIGYGGWDGTSQQVATINVDNEFTDFDEPRAETAIGWKGVTIAPKYSKGNFDLTGEVTVLDYNTNWQAWGNDRSPITSTIYPSMELDTGVGHNFRSAYAPFQDKSTTIAVLNAKGVLGSGKGVDVFGKFKYIKETDNRLNDPKYLPYVPGDCPGNTDCNDVENNYSGTNSTADIYGNPDFITVGANSGYQWKPFDSISDDDRDLKYWTLQGGLGYQLSNDLYGSAAFEHYNADLLDGNTAFQAYQLHEMASGKHVKNRLIMKGKYIMGGAELGLEYQYNFGTFEPDFGTGFIPQVADATIAADHNVPVGSLGFAGRFNGWNSLEKRDFTNQRLKAFMKVQF